MQEKVYTVTDISGEYATLRDTKTGDELFIAMALLPLGVDVGSQLLYKDMMFEITS